jgi:hypothetical protein
MFRNFLLAVLCVCLARVPASAQSTPVQVVDGVVRDTTGAVMVGVEMTLLPAEDGDPRTGASDARGRFRFEGVRSGTYTVVATAAGFAEATRRVRIAAEPIVSVELVLQVLVTEHVEVSADVSTSTPAGLAATTLTGASLQELPDDPGALLQRVRELAGATDGAGQVTITIDGFNQALWLPPKQAIQAIRISSSWFAPEFAEPGQARIDIITKPGSGRFYGEFRTNVNNEALNARNALAPRHPAGHTRDLTGYMSGPIIAGRWGFVLYAGQWAQQQIHVVNATVLDPAHQPVPFIETVVAPSRVENVWLGTNYQVASQHTLAVSFSQTRERASNLGLDSGLDLPERAYHRTGSDRALRATLTSAPSTRVLNEARLQVSPHASTTRAASAAPAVMVLDAFTGGGNQEALFAATRHTNVELHDSLTVFMPGHSLKAGFTARVEQRRYTDTAHFGGMFAFGAGFDDTGRVISPLENYRRTVQGIDGYGPSQFWITRGNPHVRFRETAWGAYAQDDWIPTPRLTLSYGLRSDWQSAASRPGVAARAGAALALDGPRRNLVRVGAGTFHQRIDPELTLDVTRLDGRHQEQLLIDHPSSFPALPAELETAVSLPTVYVADADLRAPQILMSAASYERQVMPAMFLTVRYSHQHGTRLLRTRDINVPAAAGVRYDQRFGRMLQYESSGRLRRHELASGWRWAAGRAGSFFANYSYVRGRADTDGRGTLPADSTDLAGEWGPLAADRTHSGNAGAHLTLPGGVVVSPYVLVASGRVVNLTTGLDNNADGTFTDRPALVTAGQPGSIATSYGHLLANPPAGALILERNAGRDPRSIRLDLRLSRSFRYVAGATFVVAAGASNLMNRANLEGINGVVTSPTFGQPKRAAAPRRIDLSAGVSF